MVDWQRPFKAIPVGKGRKVCDGDDVAILSIGAIGNEVVKATAALNAEGYNPAHYDLRFVKPLDEALLHDVFKKFDKVITVEDGCLEGGMGSAVLEFMVDNGYTNIRVKRLGIPDTFIEHGDQPELWADCGFDANGIAQQVRNIAGKRNVNIIAS
jgi:1-deoxy-D-xylulose-5-phosphate synthase